MELLRQVIFFYLFFSLLRHLLPENDAGKYIRLFLGLYFIAMLLGVGGRVLEELPEIMENQMVEIAEEQRVNFMEFENVGDEN